MKKARQSRTKLIFLTFSPSPQARPSPVSGLGPWTRPLAQVRSGSTAKAGRGDRERLQGRLSCESDLAPPEGARYGMVTAAAWEVALAVAGNVQQEHEATEGWTRPDVPAASLPG